MLDIKLKSDPKSTVDIYTDGACSGNPGPGGWAAILRVNDHKREISGFVPETTNNRMELTAVIEALKYLKNPSHLRIHTDSTYVKGGMTSWMTGWKARGWRTAAKKPVKNQDLWRILDTQAQQHQIQWHWVKGHAGHLGNERADQLATEAIAKNRP